MGEGGQGIGDGKGYSLLAVWKTGLGLSIYLGLSHLVREEGREQHGREGEIQQALVSRSSHRT